MISIDADPPDPRPKFVVTPVPNPNVLKAIREAAKVAETIPGAGTKSLTLVSIAEAYAKAGDRDSARAAYRKALEIVQEGMRSKDQTIITGGSTVFRDQPSLNRFGFLSKIADSQARNNFIEDAAETIKTIAENLVFIDAGGTISRNQYLTEFAKALAQDGKIEAALRLAEEIKQDEFMGTRTALLVEIAHIQAIDFPKTDRKWIDELTDPIVKSRMLLGVAAGLSGETYTPSKYRQPKAQ